MLFTNPHIIQDTNDIIIGCVEVSGDIDLIQYEGKLYKKFAKLVANQLSEIKAQGNTHDDAVNEAAQLLYSYLTVNQPQYPLTGEQIIDELMRSIQYQTWITQTYYNFMNIHKGVITKTTPIAYGGMKKELADSYQEKYTFVDLLEALSSAYIR